MKKPNKSALRAATSEGATELLDVPAVAEQLKTSRATVYNLINSGLLGDVIDIGTGTRSRLRIRADAVEAFIRSRTVPSIRAG